MPRGAPYGLDTGPYGLDTRHDLEGHSIILTNGPPTRVNQIGEDGPELRNVGTAAARAHFAIMNAAIASTHQQVGHAVGEITLILDKGSVTVRQGDVAIQRGTNHAWSNRADRPGRIAFVLIDGNITGGLAG